MNEQLRELVKSRLSDAVNCPAKDDIVEEITADLTAKYTDLLDCGLAPEEAFAKVESGIGDLQAFLDKSLPRDFDENGAKRVEIIHYTVLSKEQILELLS